MTPRQRMVSAFDYSGPDRIPVVYHGSPAGLHVHGQKLLDLFNRYPPDNPLSFDSIPGPPPEAVDEDGRYHEVRQDDWGILWEYRIYGLWGHPKAYPFDGWKAGREYQFPEQPDIGSAQFERDRAKVEEEARDYLVFRGGASIFERLHDLQPMDMVLADLAAGDEDQLAFLDRLVDHWLHSIEYWIAAGADVLSFGDDWGTQTSQIVSTDMFRRIFKPRYARLMEPIHAAGRRVFFHVCGHLGELLHELIDLGVDGLWPQINQYDEVELAETCREHGVAIYIHPDRQHLVPLGTPEEIDRKMAEYAARYRRLGGGGIFYIEIENDAPFENARALIESVDQHR
ncbi:uroporphyrinogen decarboxylase family protein [Candidatus Latescibacterota bacterium]